MVNQKTFIRRQNKLHVETGARKVRLTQQVPIIATFAKNLESLGYTLSPELVEQLKSIPCTRLKSLCKEVIDSVKSLKKADKKYNPMYKNFPEEVMNMEESELYLNAIFHYWTEGQWFPKSEKKERCPLIDNYALTQLTPGTEQEYKNIFTELIGANTSLSTQDKTELSDFLIQTGNNWEAFKEIIPENVPFKENMVTMANMAIARFPDHSADIVQKFTKTATDVLRIATAMSDGDVSLATNTKFRKFNRPERRMLSNLLPKHYILEDLLRHEEKWKKLSRAIHPQDYIEGMALTAFKHLHDKKERPKNRTFNSKVEKALIDGDIAFAAGLLKTRPGDFARRLDHLVRKTDKKAQELVIADFAEVAPQVSTQVLLNVREHFYHRSDYDKSRVFFPKGNIGKAQVIDNTLPQLDEVICLKAVEACDNALRTKFSALEPLGKVYVSPDLKGFNVPFSARSASTALRSPVRGSRFAIDDKKGKKDVLRFFLWWKNPTVGRSRADVDLSADAINEDFTQVSSIAYYNLSQGFGVHSGDIVDAPNGAAEFIDIDIEKALKAGHRYVSMTVYSFTGQKFSEYDNGCFAGWMIREDMKSGEIFEPKTVKDTFDLTAESTIALPLVFDLKERKAIWLDMVMGSRNLSAVSSANQKGGLTLAVKAMVELQKPNIYELLKLHGESRGELVDKPEDADVVYDLETINPFTLESITPFIS